MSVPTPEIVQESKTVLAARSAIIRERRGLRALLPFLGPAFIAAVAYIDPGNYDTNIQSGSEFGYKLLWVVVLANLMAMPNTNITGTNDMMILVRESNPTITWNDGPFLNVYR